MHLRIPISMFDHDFDRRSAAGLSAGAMQTGTASDDCSSSNPRLPLMCR